MAPTRQQCPGRHTTLGSQEDEGRSSCGITDDEGEASELEPWEVGGVGQRVFGTIGGLSRDLGVLSYASWMRR